MLTVQTLATLVMLGVTASGHEVADTRLPVHRVVDRVSPVCSMGRYTDAILAVQVVDDAGEPMAGVTVTVGGRPVGRTPRTVETDDRGMARVPVAKAGNLQVDAWHVGFAVSRAARVRVEPGCLSAVTLPMQVVPPRDVISP